MSTTSGSSSVSRDMVVLEACRAVCELACFGWTTSTSLVADSDVVAVVAVLQALLGSSRPVLRFAALRQLHGLAACRPADVAPANGDLEPLVTDSQRAIATLAITTLLRTGTAASVDRLLGQLRAYLGDLSDDLRTTVVEAVGALALKFPEKHGPVLAFLGWRLREDGSSGGRSSSSGVTYQRAVVRAITNILAGIPDAREPALDVLCEHVEDCEHPDVAADILHVLGMEGPGSAHPLNLVRHIYNRLLLEVPAVRMAAVGALIRFGETGSSPMKATVRQLLSRAALLDEEDDIRDRALFYLACEGKLTGRTGSGKASANVSPLSDPPATIPGIPPSTLYQLDALEASLTSYLQDGLYQESPYTVPGDIPLMPVSDLYGKGSSMGGFSTGAVSTSRPSSTIVSPLATGSMTSPVLSGPSSGGSSVVMDIMARLPPALAARLASALHWHAAPSIRLTEPGTEYDVSVIPHYFIDTTPGSSAAQSAFLVLDFTVLSTLSDVLLDRVSVHLRPVAGEAHSMTLVATLPVPSPLAEGNHGHTYAVYETNLSARRAPPVPAAWSATLLFVLHEGDADVSPSGAGEEDEYSLQDVRVGLPLVHRPAGTSWDALQPPHVSEAKAVFSLSLTTGLRTLGDVVSRILGSLGGMALQGTDKITGESSAVTHTLLLGGELPGLRGPVPVAARVRFVLSTATNVVHVECLVRSGKGEGGGGGGEEPDLTQWIVSAL
jgi:coatomer protein complex subunit gamma